MIRPHAAPIEAEPAAPAASTAAPRAWRRLLPHGLGLAIALPLLGLLGGFLWFLEAAVTPPAQPLAPTDGIVVLTGGAERVRTGLLLLAEDRAPRLLVSGTHPGTTLGELAAAAGVAPAELAAMAAADRVALGRTARSTRGNATETAAWARAEGLGSLRVVTAGYHMPRAMLELRRALPREVALVPHPVLPAPLRDASAARRLRTWTLLAGEYARLIGAALGLTRLVAEPAAARPARID